MNLFRLTYWLKDVTPKIIELDGYLFLDRFELGDVELRAEVSRRYSSLEEAQSWMNIILLDGFISEAVGDEWDSNDPLVDAFLSIFETAWSFQVEARFPKTKYAIDKVIDDESGDVGLRLTSKI